MKVIQKYLLYFSFVCSIILVINLLIPKGGYLFGMSLIALILAPYWVISMVLLFSEKSFSVNNSYFILGVMTCVFYGLISFIFEDRKSDILAISYTLAFLCNARIIQISLWDIRTIVWIRKTLFLIGVGVVLYSFGQAYGFFVNPFIELDQTLIGSVRYTFTSEIGVIPLFGLFFFDLLMNERNSLKKTVLTILIIMCFLKLVSFGTRAILIGFIISLIYLNKKVVFTPNFFKIIFLFLTLSLIVALFYPNLFVFLENYYTLMISRDSSTGNARLVEANNDWLTFLEYPIFGAGFEISSERLNNLSEPSYGHIFLTGVLGRFGLIGLCFLISYIGYFKSVKYKAKQVNKKWHKIIISYFIIIIIYFVFGNPMYLFPAWPVVPFFFIPFFLTLYKNK